MLIMYSHGIIESVMDETLAVANKDLEVRGYSKEEYLGETEVSVCIYMTYLMNSYSVHTDKSSFHVDN